MFTSQSGNASSELNRCTCSMWFGLKLFAFFSKYATISHLYSFVNYIYILMTIANPPRLPLVWLMVSMFSTLAPVHPMSLSAFTLIMVSCMIRMRGCRLRIFSFVWSCLELNPRAFQFIIRMLSASIMRVLHFPRYPRRLGRSPLSLSVVFP